MFALATRGNCTMRYLFADKPQVHCR